MQCLTSDGAGVAQVMCICQSGGCRCSAPVLCFITHPCVAGRKVASFCAFLWVIVILQLNSLEFIQPSWMLSVYFYVCGEKGRRKNPIVLVGLTVGFTLKHEILPINILGLLSLQRLIFEIFPRETRAACSQPPPHLPSCPRGCSGSCGSGCIFRGFCPALQSVAEHKPG